MTLEERVQRLEDLQEITQILIDYGELLDLRDTETWSQLWAEDAEFRMSSGRSAVGRAAIKEMLDTLMGNSPAAVMHLETNPRINLDGDKATATMMYAVASTQDDGLARITMAGHHHDHLVRTAEGWKIQLRQNVVDLPETGHP